MDPRRRRPLAATRHHLPQTAGSALLQVPDERQGVVLDVPRHVPQQGTAGRQAALQRLPVEAVRRHVL